MSVTPRPDTHRVYNLEVAAEHAYRVTKVGVLVHNSCEDEPLPREIIELAEAHLTNTGETVLGHWGFIDKAKRLKASYFWIESDIWKTLPKDQQWAANRHFLNVIAKRGDKIRMSTQKGDIRIPSTLKREIEHLIENNDYRWFNQWSLRPR